MRKYLLFLVLLLLGGTAVAIENEGYKLPFLNVDAPNQLDGVNIDPNTAGTGNFTTLAASGTVSGTGFSNYLSAPPAIGGTTPAAGSFTNLTITGTTTDFSASSSGIYGNPIMLQTTQNLASASVGTTGGFTVIASVTGRSIHPTNIILMASGALGGSTGLQVLCTSGNVLASIAAGNLKNATMVAAMASTAMNPGVAFGSGCASGDAVYVSNIGSTITGMTNLYINIPYTVQ